MTTKFLYFDTETTGLDPVRNDIIQMGAILEVDGHIIGEFNEFCAPFNPNNIDSAAVRTHGHSIDKLKEFQPPQELFKKFIKFIAQDDPAFLTKVTLVGQNTNFDRNFLQSFFIKNRYSIATVDKMFDYHYIDLQALTHLLRIKGLINPKNIKLETIAKYFGLDDTGFHDALADVRVTYKLIKKIEEIFIRNLDEIPVENLHETSPFFQHIREKRNKSPNFSVSSS